MLALEDSDQAVEATLGDNSNQHFSSMHRLVSEYAYGRPEQAVKATVDHTIRIVWEEKPMKHGEVEDE